MRLALLVTITVVPLLAATLLYERQSTLANEKPIIAAVPAPMPDAMQHLHRGPWVPQQDTSSLLRRGPYRPAP